MYTVWWVLRLIIQDGKWWFNFAAALGLTENKLMLKDEDLYTMYHAETCQVYLHNVKENYLKFPVMREHFGMFGGISIEIEVASKW